MTMIKRPLLTMAAYAMALLVGCGKDDAPPPVPARAVKTFLVGSPDAAGSFRRFSGTVRASERADLSFAVSGKIVELTMEVGEAFREDAVLARLDRELFRLRLAQAEADRRRASAQQVEAARKLEAQRALIAKKFTTRQALDEAIAAQAAAASALQSAQAAVRLARRDLASTVLTAPFAGQVATRRVEAFTEVQAGQAVLEIDGLGRREVLALIPVDVARRLTVGSAARIRGGIEDRMIPGRIVELGRRAAGGTVEAIVVPTAGNLEFTGSTAEVLLDTPTEGPPSRGHAIPLTALLPGPKSGQGRVFVLHGNDVRSREVRTGELLGDRILVIQGLRERDVIVASGPGFLYDGQRISRLAPVPR